MENILNLKTYNKYINLIKEGLILLPDNNLSNLIKDITKAYKSKPVMQLGETHEVSLKAGKKVQITSRGSIRDVAIDGVHYDSIAQAACSIYDPYDNYYDISNDIRINMLDYTFIPIIDNDKDTIRYTISKYSKGLSKYFDPHKVVKAVYSLHHALFYVKDDKDILRKIYFKIQSVSMADIIPQFCKIAALKNGPESDIYLAFFIHEEDLPFTMGVCKEDFYALKDILNKISFKGTTPLKYMVFKDLKDMKSKSLKSKQQITYNQAMLLQDTSKEELCDSLYIDEDTYDKMMNEELQEIENKKGMTVTRLKIAKVLNILDNVTEIHYYESNNLMWKVRYDEIPSSL